MKTLQLAVKTIYFNQIKSGEKLEEYRLINEYWAKRLQNKTYDQIIITNGYPKKDDFSKRLIFKWYGVIEKTLTHPHFGNQPVQVFAIQLKF